MALIIQVRWDWISANMLASAMPMSPVITVRTRIMSGSADLRLNQVDLLLQALEKIHEEPAGPFPFQPLHLGHRVEQPGCEQEFRFHPVGKMERQDCLSPVGREAFSHNVTSCKDAIYLTISHVGPQPAARGGRPPRSPVLAG